MTRLDKSVVVATESGAGRIDCGATPTGAVAVGDGVMAGFGDGTVRIFRSGAAPQVIAPHKGVVLAMAADPAGGLITGGDDGRCLFVSEQGGVEEVAVFDRGWVDCVAATRSEARSDARAASVGKTVHLWEQGGTRMHRLDHPSTVGGLAFDPKGERLAVAHYGGVTLWRREKRGWKSSRLIWTGSHLAASWSPDGRFLVTSMQENALHGWRLRDKANMRMSGYPMRVRSTVWAGSWLVTSGADAAIGWPFDGPNGPMGKSPLMVCAAGGPMVSAVAGLPGGRAVLAGFENGMVLVSEPAEGAEVFQILPAEGAPIVAMAVSSDGWLFAAAEDGTAFWGALGRD